MFVRIEVVDKDNGVTHSDRVDIRRPGITAWFVMMVIKGALSFLSDR